MESSRKTPSWRRLGALGAAPGAFWRRLGASWGPLDSSWGLFGRSRERLGAHWAALGGLLGLSRRLWGTLGALSAAPKGLLGPSRKLPGRRGMPHREDARNLVKTVVFAAFCKVLRPPRGLQMASGGLPGPPDGFLWGQNTTVRANIVTVRMKAPFWTPPSTICTALPRFSGPSEPAAPRRTQVKAPRKAI